MNLTIEQLAEILAGIAKAQQAIIDGIESESGGWKNTHLIPKLTTASNMRLATPRLMDVPSRVLLRSQSRVVMDVATITRMLHEAVSGEPVPAVTPARPAVSIPADYVASTPAAAAPATAPSAAAPVAPAASAAPAAPAAVKPAPGAEVDLGNFFDN
ncbi:MAG: hypothetical protein IPP88_01915 [Betaproteobacteria bacterium]|nr:hypothetical protein [Betaproteobacteria bacterium]